jgi:DNA-binding MarR family transcriptional regulator
MLDASLFQFSERMPQFSSFNPIDDSIFRIMAHHDIIAMLKAPGLRDAPVLRAALALELIAARAERRCIEEVGVSVRDLWIIRAAIEGKYSQLRLADALNINPNVMVLIIDRLEQRKLVARVRNPKNRREALVVPTTKGRKLIAGSERTKDAANKNIFAPLTKSEMQTFTGMCEAILVHAENATDTRRRKPKR